MPHIKPRPADHSPWPTANDSGRAAGHQCGIPRVAGLPILRKFPVLSFLPRHTPWLPWSPWSGKLQSAELVSDAPMPHTSPMCKQGIWSDSPLLARRASVRCLGKAVVRGYNPAGAAAGEVSGNAGI